VINRLVLPKEHQLVDHEDAREASSRTQPATIVMIMGLLGSEQQ